MKTVRTWRKGSSVLIFDPDTKKVATIYRSPGGNFFPVWASAWRDPLPGERKKIFTNAGKVRAALKDFTGKLERL